MRKSAKKAKERLPKKAKIATPAPRVSKTEVRKGSKLETIVGLLKRPGGCTMKDILDATGWPAVSVPQQARAAGIKLHKAKINGITHYSAA